MKKTDQEKIEAMVRFLEEHPDLAIGEINDNNLWDQMADELNELREDDNDVRTTREWMNRVKWICIAIWVNWYENMHIL